MTPKGSRTRSSPARLHYAWIVALVTFAVPLITAGIRATPGILMVPLEREFGWVGASMAAYGADAIRTGLGDYGLAFWIAGGLCIVAGASFLTIGRRAFPRQPVVPPVAVAAPA